MVLVIENRRRIHWRRDLRDIVSEEKRSSGYAQVR